MSRLTPDELRRKIIMIPQTVSLFSGTVRDNLLIASPGASDGELLEALGQVRLRDWVLEQPDGLSTDVGDAGGRLSGGQAAENRHRPRAALQSRVHYL